jgi:transglutaminase-like putative cysteine protease
MAESARRREVRRISGARRPSLHSLREWLTVAAKLDIIRFAMIAVSEESFRFSARFPFEDWITSTFMETLDPGGLQKLNITVRVGCNLAYETTHEAVLLLNMRPRTDLQQSVQEERLSFGANLPSEEFTDSHGNTIYRVMLQAGRTEIRHDALICVSSDFDNHHLSASDPVAPGALHPSLLRYTLPSRYCDSDKLGAFAWQQFGHVENGVQRVQAICDWLHTHIEYRFASGRPDLSAWDVIQRGYGVCRDFAHTLVALCRSFNLPARYITGHLPDIGFPDRENHMDFHAYAEIYLKGGWHTFDARFNVPRVGRIKVSAGLDAVDGAFSTIYGAADLSSFQVWAYQVVRGSVSVGDPLDYSKRLDNQWEIRTE